MVSLKNRVSRKVTSAAATISWKTFFAIESIAEYELLSDQFGAQLITEPVFKP
jgi:hypothetical protein